MNVKPGQNKEKNKFLFELIHFFGSFLRRTIICICLSHLSSYRNLIVQSAHIYADKRTYELTSMSCIRYMTYGHRTELGIQPNPIYIHTSNLPVVCFICKYVSPHFVRNLSLLMFLIVTLAFTFAQIRGFHWDTRCEANAFDIQKVIK